MKWTYSSALQAAGFSLPNVEMAESESLGHPGGMQDTSRWLSVAIPPDSSPPISSRTPAGVQDASVPAGPGVPHPCRGARKEEGAPVPGGIASLNHRLMSCIPPGCPRLSLWPFPRLAESNRQLGARKSTFTSLAGGRPGPPRQSLVGRPQVLHTSLVNTHLSHRGRYQRESPRCAFPRTRPRSFLPGDSGTKTLLDIFGGVG